MHEYHNTDLVLFHLVANHIVVIILFQLELSCHTTKHSLTTKQNTQHSTFSKELTHLFQFGFVDSGEELERSAPLIHRLIIVAKYDSAFANVGTCCNTNQSFTRTTRQNNDA